MEITDEEVRRIVGDNILEARLGRGWTQHQLGALLGGLPGDRVGKWERGEQFPTLSNLTMLARVLSVPIHWLFSPNEGPGI